MSKELWIALGAIALGAYALVGRSARERSTSTPKTDLHTWEGEGGNVAPHATATQDHSVDHPTSPTSSNGYRPAGA